MKYGVTANFTGIVTANSYNPRLQPVILSASAPSQTIISFSYDFHLGVNDNGNVYGITNGLDGIRPNRPNGSAVYTYDQLNRIASAHSPGATPDCTVLPSGLTKDWGQTFTVDIWGNLTNIAVERCSTPILNAPVNEKNQFVGTAYDAAGNLWSNWQYPFDAENRMARTAGVEYTYDGDGERVKKSSGTLYWGLASNEPLAESDLSGNLQKEFIFFGGKRIARLDLPGGAVHYYFSDHLGSSNVVTNATGTTIEEESDFYPFGGERAITDLLPDQRYKFTGKERDPETGLDYFGARYYSSSLGRFMTPDWAAKPTAVPYANFGNPQSLNLYGYVQNNPTTLGDPDGHCPECIGFILGAGVGSLEILYQTGDAYFNGKGHIPTNQETADKLLERSLEGAGAGAAYHASQQGEAPAPDSEASPKPDNEDQPGAQRSPRHDPLPEGTSPQPSGNSADGRSQQGLGTVPASDRDPKRSFDRQTKQEKRDEAGGQCTICGQETVPAQKHQKGVTPPGNEGQTHHVIPWSQGGRTVPDNAAHVCRDCNLNGGKKKD